MSFTHGRTVLVGALCALSVPAVALAAEPATSSAAATSSGACNCDQTCSERTAAEARARAERRRAAARRRALAPRQNASVAGITSVIDTRISRPVAGGCTYTADAQGSYRAASITAQGGVRDVNVHGTAALTCGGQVVRRERHQFIFPVASRQQMVDALEARLGVSVPGSACSVAGRFAFDGGQLQANRVDSSCSPRQAAAAVSGYTQQPAIESARGGGPGAEPTSRDARYGTH